MSFETCTTRQPLRCWCYRRSKHHGQPLPLWTARHLSVNGEKVEFMFSNNGGEIELEVGDWVVELVHGDEDYVAVYSEKEFREIFDLTPEAI